jgi:predicted transcriptional regulator
VNFNELSRRAAGRRAYNNHRQSLCEQRRVQVVDLLSRLGGRYGSQARIARMLKVSEATISRDMKVLHREWRKGIT